MRFLNHSCLKINPTTKNKSGRKKLSVLAYVLGWISFGIHVIGIGAVIITFIFWSPIEAVEVTAPFYGKYGWAAAVLFAIPAIIIGIMGMTGNKDKYKKMIAEWGMFLGIAAIMIIFVILGIGWALS